MSSQVWNDWNFRQLSSNSSALFAELSSEFFIRIIKSVLQNWLYWALMALRGSFYLESWQSIGQNKSQNHGIWINLNKTFHCEWLEIAPLCANSATLVTGHFYKRWKIMDAGKFGTRKIRDALTLCFTLATVCTSALFGMAATSSLCCCCCWFGCWFGCWGVGPSIT